MFNPSRLRQAFRALRHRNFQLFWAGQGVSVIGTWMQTTAQSWLLYNLTHSPLLLGFLTVARFGPSLVIAPLAGLVADRFPRQRVVILTQATSLVLASLLAYLTLAGFIRVWQILLLAFLQGSVDSLDMTVRQTFQMDLVGPEDLQSAVSLNSAAFNSARMVGPFLAGILIEHLGEGLCFALNALSYIAVLVSLFLIRTKLDEIPAANRSAAEAIAAGMRYAWETPFVRRVMLAVALTSVVGLSANTLTPALARDILHTGSQGYGRLLAGAGIGAILGSLAAAATSSSRRTPLVNFATLCGLGCSLLGLGLTHTLPMAVFCMTLIGSMASVQLSTSNTFLQTSAPPHMRGRVVSMYVWIFQGLAPVGGFTAGWVASKAGIPTAILGAGSICLAAGLAFGATRPARPDRRH
jgi:MFS family permease